MSKYQNRRLLIYRLIDAKEADRVIYALSEEGEKIVFVAKGVKKEKSRKAHAVDMLNLVQAKLTLVSEAPGAMPTMLEVQLEQDFLKFKRDYAGLIFCQVICELISFFAEEGQEDRGIYANIVQLLMAAKGERYALLVSAVILRLLNSAGLLPVLNLDVNTGELLENGNRFLAAQIGYTSTESDFVISDRIYKTQQFILKSDFTKIQQIALTPEEDMLMLEIHLKWLQESTERELKTMNLFKESLKT